MNRVALAASALFALTLSAHADTGLDFKLNNATGYVPPTSNLPSYIGQTISLKFTGTEDSSLQTSFVVDDTALNVS